MKPYNNFRKTDDKNIVLADCTTTEEIYIDKLKNRIAHLKETIDSMEEPIPTEGVKDERVLKLVMLHNTMLPDRTVSEAELNEKKKLLAILKEL